MVLIFQALAGTVNRAAAPGGAPAQRAWADAALFRYIASSAYLSSSSGSVASSGQRAAPSARGWTQAEAARQLGITQPRVSRLIKGKVEDFNLDMLLTLAARAGLHPELRLTA